MSFLNPWAIGIGAAAILAPLAVHFLTRPRPVSFPLSTILFLREVIEQRRARSRIRDLIVLLLRMLAVGLLAMALGRPLWERAPLVAPQSAGNVSRVVLFDVSQSMSAGTGGSTALQRAQATALRYLDYSPGLQADVVFIGANIQDEEPAARAFLEEFGISYPNVIDRGSRVAIAYGVWGLPETFIIDRQGRITYKHVGALGWTAVTAKIEEALRGVVSATEGRGDYRQAVQ